MVNTLRHALLRDAAYESLLRTKRVQIHIEVARAARDVFPDLATQQPELIAHHLAEGHDLREAVDLFLQAEGNAQLELEVALERGHPANVAAANIWNGIINLLRGDPEAAMPFAQACMDLGRDRGFPARQYLAMSVHGAALGGLGSRGKGMEQMKTALDQFERIGFNRFRPLAMGLLRHGLLHEGEPEAAGRLADRGIGWARSSGERWFEPDLLRLKALSLAAHPVRADRAHETFKEALALARRARMRLSEFNFVIDYIANWAACGERADARAILYPACDWFAARRDERITTGAKDILQ